MDTIIKLRKMFQYSTVPIMVVGALLAAVTLAIIIYIIVRIVSRLLKNRKKKPEIVVVRETSWTKPDMAKLRAEYLARLDAIEADFNKDTTGIRPAYENMSRTVREFAYKATGVAVDKYTLSEIRSTEFGSLAELVEEYYEPEFDKISEGDVRQSLENSRRLVRQWN